MQDVRCEYSAQSTSINLKPVKSDSGLQCWRERGCRRSYSDSQTLRDRKQQFPAEISQHKWHVMNRFTLSSRFNTSALQGSLPDSAWQTLVQVRDFLFYFLFSSGISEIDTHILGLCATTSSVDLEPRIGRAQCGILGDWQMTEHVLVRPDCGSF